MSDSALRPRIVWAIARMDLLRLRHRPRAVLRVVILQLFVVGVAVLLPRVMVERSENDYHVTAQVALTVVAADQGREIETLLGDQLRAAGLRPVKLGSAEEAVKSRRAAVGLIVTRRGVADDWDARVVVDGARSVSRAAAARVTVAIQATQDTIYRSAPGPRRGVPVFDTRVVLTEERRSRLPNVLPFLFLAAVAEASSFAAGTVLGDRATRSYEALASTSATSLELAVGKTLAAFLNGLAMLAVTLAVVASVISPVLVAVFHDTEIVGSRFYWLAFSAGIPFAMFLAALGVSVGLRSRSPSEGSARLALAQLPLMLASGVLLFVPDLFANATHVQAIPLLGPLVSVQNASSGRPVSPFSFIAATAAIALAVLFVRVAARAAHTPRAVLRPIE